MATWVAGLGALLLLAAATTFLVVHWDALGVTARVAVVGGATAAAVLGGARLRRTLPMVGAVIFHLGAMLLPVDALGLTIQLDAPGWARWVAVGLTAMLVLPMLAVVGRAPLLGVAAITGVPVAATGFSLLGGPAPALVVAIVGALSLVLLRTRPLPGLELLARGTSLLLPVVAVVVGVAVEVLGALATEGVSATLVTAGWIAPWPIRAAVLVLAGGTLTARARSGDPRLVALAVATSTLALLHLLLPASTPRAVQLWTPGMLWVALESAALALRRGGTPPRVVQVGSVVAAVLAAPVALGVVGQILSSAALVPPDTVLAGLVVLLATAWGLAGVRWHRDLPTAPSIGPGVLLLAAGHLVLVPPLLGASVTVSVVLALLPAVVLPPLLGRLPGPDAGTGTVSPRPSATTALVAVLVLLAAAGGLSGGDPTALLVAVVAPLLALPYLAALTRGPSTTPPAGWAVGLAAAILLVGVTTLALAGLDAAGLHLGPAGVLAGVVAVGISVAVGSYRVVADAARLLAGVAGLVTVVTWYPGSVAPATSLAPVLSPGGLLPALVLGVLLLLSAVDDRGALAWSTATVLLLRAGTIAVLLAGVPVEVVGAVLLAVGIVAALAVAAAGAPWNRTGSVVGAVVALTTIPGGWVLLGEAARLRATALLVAGVVTVLLSPVLRRPALGHLGAAIATLGAWGLLVDLGRTELDLWLLPLAGQLVLAGAAARRHGETSSWLAYAPAVALVGIPAVLERLAGGPAWHGLLAGSVGVLAVVLGGRSGLRGPLFTGSAIVLAAVVVETLTVVVGLPTWAWLTAGGVGLLMAAASIERLGQDPADAARRVAAGLRDRDRR